LAFVDGNYYFELHINLCLDVVLEILIQEDPQAQGLDVVHQLLSANQLGLQLHGFLKEIVNTSSRLERLGYQPRAKSKINIPLCHMISLLVVGLF